MGLEATFKEESAPEEVESDLGRKDTQTSKESLTASEFIDSQLQLEKDAREVLPYSFDTCTQPLGPLRQTVFACLTCSPPPASAAQVYTPAGVCYSCSISCHGEHTLVELFSRRNFVCDCGSTRLPEFSPCTLRADPITGSKGVNSQAAAKDNHYNHNFQNLFCGCGAEYDAHQEKGTMFQCLGLGTVETGGCGEDWWHPQCLMGLPKDWHTAEARKLKIEDGFSDNHTIETEQGHTHNQITGEEQSDADDEPATPQGFPDEEDFETFVCYKCVESNPWIKQYAGTTGFLSPVFKKVSSSAYDTAVGGVEQGDPATKNSAPPEINGSKKRKASDDEADGRSPSPAKRPKDDSSVENEPAASSAATTTATLPKQKHDALPQAPMGTFSLFLKEDFREHLCHCPSCYPHLLPHPQLLEEEDVYEPPLSEAGDSEAVPGSGARSQGTGSLLDRGEAALSTMDRVRAIEGVMAYNHLKDKVKDFLKPYAESGKPVGAEDIKAYFEKLRGDDAAIKEAGERRGVNGKGSEDEEGGSGDNRREQSGY